MLPSRWENVNRCSIKLIYFCNKLRLASDCKQSKYSQQIYNSYTYFSILSVAFAVSFLCYFQKLQLFDVKKIWTNFCCILLLYLWAQKVCLRFLKPYFKLDILIFLSFVMSFLVDTFNQNAPFWRKSISGEISDTLLKTGRCESLSKKIWKKTLVSSW